MLAARETPPEPDNERALARGGVRLGVPVVVDEKNVGSQETHGDAGEDDDAFRQVKTVIETATSPKKTNTSRSPSPW